MSYDIYLTINTGKQETTVCEVGNYTSNIRKMLDTAFKVQDWKYIDRKKAGEVLPEITSAYLHMVQNPEIYKPMNPKNGWGNYEGCTELLRKLMTAASIHTDCIIQISA